MYKKLFITVLSLVLYAVFAHSSFAAPTLSLRIEQPQSPTSQSSFPVNFVALTTTGNAVTVDCWKKGPSDASFVQFDSITLSSGGNTDNCPVDSSVVNTTGTYMFAVTGTDGTSTVDLSSAPQVSVAFDTSVPGDPTNYSKSQNGSCQYVISFTTANDNGQTVRVELYRSQSTNFTVDASNKVDSQNIGSNTSGSFTNTVPDCSQTWYFAIRAFNNEGNGSNAVGDSTTTTNTVTVNPTSTQQQPGAVVVANANSQVAAPTGGQTTVEGTSPAPTEGQKNVLGAQTHATPTQTQKGIVATLLSNKKIFALGALGIVILLGILYYFFVRSQKSK